MDELDKIKRRLGIVDKEQDQLLFDLYEDAEAYFRVLTKVEDIDEAYRFIIREVTLKLYNRKGSEGIESESIDGYSAKYASALFADYLDLLERDFDIGGTEHRKTGAVRFL